MTSDVTLSGTCLCGACTFSAAQTDQGGGICHCSMCRKWSGGIYLSVDCGSSVAFAPGSPTGSYKGSAWGERIFCTTCGSSLLWQTQDGANQHVSIHCFEDPEQFDLGVELFIDLKPSNYALSGDRKTMTEADVVAMFAPSEGDTTQEAKP